MKLFVRLLFMPLIVSLSACQMFGTSSQKLNPYSLESLQPALISIDKQASLNLDLNEVIESYTRLLPLLKDPETQMKVLHRLADLKLQKGEFLMAEQAIDELDIAIQAYQGLLAKYPNRTDNDQVLYQLAKTYELKGMRAAHLDTLTRIVNEYPGSVHYAEVQFRRGEILFSDDAYAAAQKAFLAVIETGDDTFLANSHYMHGWSLFKQANYGTALLSYTNVLDLLVNGDASQSDLIEPLIKPQYQTLVADLMRVMSLSFSYLGGEKGIAELFVQTGDRAYEHIIYASYSKFLLSKEQYTDAIAVYKGFIERKPLSLWSPKFHVEVINSLAQAGFKRDIVQEKISFVDTYGISSVYWSNYSRQDLAFVSVQLESILLELSDRFYVKAQAAHKKYGSRIGPKRKSEMLENYQLSTRYNREFIKVFPKHTLVPDRLFLLAEGELQLGHYKEAILAFERAGYEYLTFERAAESAYASILAYDEYAKSWHLVALEDVANLRRLREQNRMRFVDKHREDKRALSVLYLVLSEKYAAKDYAQSLALSQRLIDWPQSFKTAPVADNKMLTETLLIKAHSLYALHDYVLAEPAYQVALSRLNKTDKRRAQLVENLAASVYKQAEAKLADGELRLAVNEFLRVGQVAPGASLRANAEYDAAGYLIELQDWHKAIEVVNAFRRAYPKHQYIDTLPAKMALAFRETEQWEAAAGELNTMRKLAKTEQEKQDILFIVAELYDKAKNDTQAILSYRLYANTYAEPADVYMEVTHRLAALYDKTDKPLKRRFWLAKQMKKVDALGDKADDRMRYLAASAANVLANDAFYQYKKIKLKLPLNVTMIKKTEALQKAMKAFQKTASYGVSQFSTEAGYRMADIYAQLSQDLMDSDRPDGLNELELEQYEILLEEQAFPFEDSAIEIHEQNASRSWNGLYDDWVKESFESLKRLLPGRYAKDELQSEVLNELY